MPHFDLERRYSGMVAGIDEAGIGCWAGPVVAAAAIVPYETPTAVLAQIDDSKKLTRLKRETVFNTFHEGGILFSWASASVAEIDHMNIRQATLLAMRRALDGLPVLPDYALIDGIARPTLPIPFDTVVKGDQKSYAIAAASIVAKVIRDGLMADLAAQYPFYGWARNAGYGTKLHIAALEKYGVTPHHRQTYAPILAFSARQG